MVDARNVSMLSLDITVHNGIASHGRATAGADHSRPQGLALIPKEPHPWAIGPLGKGTGPRKTRVRTLPDAALDRGSRRLSRAGFGKRCGQGMAGLRILAAASRPATGRPAGSRRPRCTRTGAWSQEMSS